jgi:hypothetical protein
MSCNITRFYYCEPDITTVVFLRRDYYLRNGVAFDDIETIEADAFEQKLIAEEEDYLRVDL